MGRFTASFREEGEEEARRRVGSHEGEEEAEEREPATTGGCIDFRFISLVAFVGEISLAGPLVKITLSNLRGYNHRHGCTRLREKLATRRRRGSLAIPKLAHQLRLDNYRIRQFLINASVTNLPMQQQFRESFLHDVFVRVLQSRA